VQLTEIEALYQGIQSLMAGDISHFILSHETLAVALDHIQHYLDSTQPHMTLCQRDLAFYYNNAEFKTFRKDSTLFLVMDVPITSDNLAHNFQLYDVIKLPIAIPEMHGYYSMLATDITTIGSAKDADVFIQMTDNRQPLNDIWHVSDVALTFLDRNRPTCTRGLMEGNLSEIKATCRYRVHKSAHPRSVLRVHGNTFLLTNITELRLHCPGHFQGQEQGLALKPFISLIATVTKFTRINFASYLIYIFAMSPWI